MRLLASMACSFALGLSAAGGFALAEEPKAPATPTPQPTPTAAPKPAEQPVPPYSIDDKGIHWRSGKDIKLDLNFFVQYQARFSRTKYLFGGPLYGFARSSEGSGVLPLYDTNLPGKLNQRVRTARAILNGQIYAPWLGFRVELDAQGEEAKPELLDAYLRIGTPDRLELRVGQFKTPFDLFQLAPDYMQPFPEAPLADETFWGSQGKTDTQLGYLKTLRVGRDVGAMVSWRSENRRRWLRASVQNGSQRNLPEGNPSKSIALRMEFQGPGGFDGDLSALSHPEKIQWTAGVGAFYNQVDRKPMSCLPGTDTDCKYPDTNNQQAVELFSALRFTNVQLNLSAQFWNLENDGLRYNGPSSKYSHIINAEEAAPYLKVDDRKYTVLKGSISYWLNRSIEIVALGAKVSDSDASMEAPLYGPHAIRNTEEMSYVLVERPDLFAAKRASRQWGVCSNFYIKKQNAKVQLGYLRNKSTFEYRDLFLALVPDIRSDGSLARQSDYQIRQGTVARRATTIYSTFSFYF